MESITSDEFKRLRLDGYTDAAGRPTRLALNAINECARTSDENLRLRSSANFNALADRQRMGSS